MSRPEHQNVFVEIMSPVFPLLKEEAGKLEKDALTYKLSLYFFADITCTSPPQTSPALA